MSGPTSLLDLHRRLLAGDRTAADSLITLLLVPLQRQLPGRDGDNKLDAVVDALLDLVKRPNTFDPAKGPLAPFLLRAARCNLMNLRRGDHRRRNRETRAAQVQKNYVELRPRAGNLNVEDEDAAHQRLLAVLGPADRPVAELQLQGERRTKVFAVAMNLADRPTAEQREAVKRAKDRVNKTRLRMKG